MDSLEGDINASLPTITEEDGESVRSGSTAKSIPNNTNTTAAEDAKKEKKKKKKSKNKEAAAAAAIYSEDHDTAHQILVDLCTEMKELKNSMQERQEQTSAAMTSNLNSNQQVMQSLTDQMGALQSNMKQLDMVIESNATPEQIEELARIRAVQEMMKVVTDDKERTVGVYEQHARRGYEEIERLRQDLASERKEVASLRAELVIVRKDREYRAGTEGGGGPMANMIVGADGGSVGDRGKFVVNGGVVGGSQLRLSGDGSNINAGGDFDDMTLETKGSYDTVAYETKSLKKRIIHMKKKLTVAQMEAKEASELRSEVERLRVKCETERKASAAKDETIQRLEKEIVELKRNQANAAAALRTQRPPQAPAPPPPTSTRSRNGSQSSKGSRSVTVKKDKSKKWWEKI
mmetsp:Transcript_26061/g.56223  ORF Transcript_26061/g.56223 Transcript_26061/m.56223 type:complete len:405 (+) Transcript_26061:142-1356(+)